MPGMNRSANKSLHWLLVIMMLFTLITPGGWINTASAEAAAEKVAGWVFTSETSFTANSGNGLNNGISLFSISGNRTASYTGSSTTIYTNSWDTPNSYWQIKLNSTGYSQLALSSMNYGTNTSPKEFKLQYSTDGSTFQDVPNSSYTLTTTNSKVVDNVPLPSAASDQSELYIRWVNTSNVSINNGTVANTGNSRISNIEVWGVPMGAPSTSAVVASPAPNAWLVGTEIMLSSSTVGASVYVNTGAGYNLYTGPIVLTDSMALQTYASAPGHANSAETTLDYAVLEKKSIAETRTAPKSRNVWTRGIVTHIDGQEMYIQDGEAGIVLYSFPSFAEVGDEIEVAGTMDIYRNLEEIKPVNGLSYTVVQENAGVPAAKLITASDLSEANGAQHEAQLVYLEDVKIDSKSGSVVTASQGGTTFTIYSSLSKLVEGKTFEKVTGVIKQFDSSYQLIPLGDHALVENVFSVTAVPGAGKIIKGKGVTLTSPTAGTSIYYTLDGSTPTKNSILYKSSIQVNENVTIKAIAVKDAEESPVYTFEYTATEQPRIHDIQGETHTSEYVGQKVEEIEGIVTQLGYTFATGAYKGFYIQDPTPDNKVNTSEAIYVFSTNEALKPAVGDKVLVSGTVSEYNEGSSSNLTSTQITLSTITKVSSGNDLPAPVVLGKNGRMIPSSIIDNDAMTLFEPEEDAIDFYESLEGMRVELQNATILSPYWTSGTDSSMLYNIPTRVENDGNEVLTPAGGLVLKEAGHFNPQRLLLAYGNPGQEVSTGDTFAAPITGVIGYNFGNYKVIPAQNSLPAIQSSTVQQETSTITKDDNKLTVATYNIENFYPGVGDVKINKLADSFVNSLKAPDIIGVVEMQDNNGETDDGTVEADLGAKALIDAIKAKGGPDYLYTDVAPENKKDGGAPGGNIRVGFLYNPARVTLSGSVSNARGNATTAVAYDAATGQLTYNPGRIDPTNSAYNSSRKPVAAQFEFRGEKVIVVAAHFNSKGGDNGPFGKVQPPVLSSEVQRHQIATVVNGFVKNVMTANPKANIVVVGDLNDFQFTQTVTILKGNELDNLIDTLPQGERYTYTFDGNSQALDHILVSKNLTAKSEVDIVHLNADFSPSKGRVSDHDPIVAQIDLLGTTPPQGHIKLQILGVNDLHGYIDVKFNEKDSGINKDLDGDGHKDKDLGGMQFLATHIAAKRATNPNTLLVHSGDMVGASPPLSALFQDEPTIEVLNQIGFDIGAVGNHEFDEGTNELIRLAEGGAHPDGKGSPTYKGMEFPILGANVRYKSTNKHAFKPYVVKEVEGVKVGFIGVVTESTPHIVIPTGIQDLVFTDAVEEVNLAVSELKDQGVKAIIVLAHMAADADAHNTLTGEAVDLANKIDDEVDVIFAAHNHKEVKGEVDGKLVVSAWEYSKALMDVDLEISRETGDVVSKTAEILYNLRTVDADVHVQGIIDHYHQLAGSQLQQVVGYNAKDMGKDYPGLGIGVYGDKPLGNLIADAMRAEMNADFALMNGGGVRDTLNVGDITWEELYKIQPFNNTLIKVEVTGAQMKEIVEPLLGTNPVFGPDSHIGGFRYTWAVVGNTRKVIDLTLPDGTPLDPNATYTVVVNSFMFTNTSDRYVRIHTLGQNPVQGPEDLQATVNFVKNYNGPVSYVAEGRIRQVEDPNGDASLRIMYSNDTHANLDNVPRKVTAVRELRQETRNSVLLDAGDVFSGTLYFNKFLGQADLEFMNMLDYDAMTFGNHEFDKGPQVLADFVKGAKFPFVSSNVDFGQEPLLSGYVRNEIGKPAKDGHIYSSIILDVYGHKVGVFGLTTEDTAFLSSPGANITFENYLDKAQQTVQQLQAAGINKIIAVTHLGYEFDKVLANTVTGIDVIVGGHSHTKLNVPVVIQKTEPVLIVQGEDYNKYLGLLDVVFTPDGVLKSWNGKLVDLGKSAAKPFAEDAVAKAKLAVYAAELEQLRKEIVGKTSVVLDGVRDNVRVRETNLGNLITDGMVSRAREMGVPATLAIQNGGGIRESIPAGDINLGQVMTVMPFGNLLVGLKMTGQEVIDALEHGVAKVELKEGRFPQVSGMKFTYDSSKPAGERIVSVQVKTDTGYTNIDPNAYYIVATNAFLADGGDGYTMMKQAKSEGRFYELFEVDYQVFVDYLAKFSSVSPQVEGRIVDLKGQDLTPPVWPSNKSLTASNISTSSLQLTWSKATDNVAVTDYKVFNGTNLIKTVAGSVYSVTVDNLSSSTTYKFTVQAVDAAGHVTTDGPTITVTTDSDSESTPNTNTSGGTSGQPSTTPEVPTEVTSKGVELKFDEKSVKKETEANGQVVTKLEVDAATLTKAFEQLSSSNAGKIAVIQLSNVEGAAKVALPADALKSAAASTAGAVIQINADGKSYDLPLSILKVDTLAAALGTTADQVTISVKIEEVTGAEAQQVQSSASQTGVELLAEAVSFTITAEAGSSTTEVNDFGNIYVTRSLTIQKPVNGSEATAVVFDPATQEFSFVPAVFEVVDGKTVVQMKRNSNSTYTVVKANKTFSDLNGHWSQTDVELLASKLVVKGQTETTFAPDSSITRAEFAALLVRALGLKESKATLSGLNDVTGNEWFAGALGAAMKAGLVDGFEDGTFRPNATITREQMAVMISRAITAAGKRAAGDATVAAKFADGGKIQSWAVEAVAVNATAGIVQGNESNQFQPEKQASRAEATVMLKRLLQHVGFIN
ncbi:5'-nucleotidase C-terminal domain-containing protein [Paenibacillus sp. YYML68]|uniref:5'-nucleotidase C-terminal domain-containing protein n=1 Tax=Paenibacillus sp. YYML68 TaxID=2909250 RepID=UPI002490CB28|nr:5'-nucleotidase C-terminal domain-containing protein [Paenibacillus sp. YYML68]